jgi:hypothetical protein
LSKYTNIKEKRDEINPNYFDNLLISIIDYLNQDSINKNLVVFLNVIFKDNIFKEKIMPKINLDTTSKNKNKENAKKIKILLFGLRFVFSVLINQKENLDNKNLFYNNLLSKNISSTLDNYFIPGNFPIEENNNNSLKGLKSVDKNIFEKNDNIINVGKDYNDFNNFNSISNNNNNSNNNTKKITSNDEIERRKLIDKNYEEIMKNMELLGIDRM